MKSTNKNTKWTIYVHTNLITGKKYVGQTRQKPERRWKNGSGYKNQSFYDVIQTYGWNNFSHEILEVVSSQEEANERERFYIKKYDSRNKGYNREDGGINEVYTGGRKIECDGIIYDSVAECARHLNISYGTLYEYLYEYLSNKRLPKNLYDKKLRFLEDDFKDYTYFTKEDISKSISKAIKGRIPANRKKVICEDVIYNSVTECAKHYGIGRNTLGSYLNKREKVPKTWVERGLSFVEEQ